MRELTPRSLGGLSEADAAAVFKKLMRLLEKQAARYTTGDSSSIREETARELLVSIRFTLGFYLQESGLPAGLLVSADMDEIFSLGLGLIEKPSFGSTVSMKPPVSARPILKTFHSGTRSAVSALSGGITITAFLPTPCPVISTISSAVPFRRTFSASNT
jgi:hypothetical protein